MACPHCASTITTQRHKMTQLGYRTFFCCDCKRTFNERTGTPFNYLEFPTDIVLLVVLWRIRYKIRTTKRQRVPPLSQQRREYCPRFQTLMSEVMAA